MEEIRSAAQAFHVKSSNEEKKVTQDLFKALDTKGDGRIGFKIFKEMFEEENLETYITDPNFFSDLDNDEDGFLDEQDIITLSYLIQTGRLWYCNSCGRFVKGQFFACVQCFSSSTDGSFYKLCSSCYHRRTFSHQENHAEFSDNASLLMKKRKESGKSPASDSSFAVENGKLVMKKMAIKVAIGVAFATLCTIM